MNQVKRIVAKQYAIDKLQHTAHKILNRGTTSNDFRLSYITRSNEYRLGELVRNGFQGQSVD